MREGNLKLVVNHKSAKNGTFENPVLSLYDLSKDLGEKNDLVEQYPDKAKAMYEDLMAHFKELQATATPQVGGWHETPNWDKNEWGKFKKKKILEWKQMKKDSSK